MKDRYGPWAVIAGASEGIGAAFARQLADHGLSLVLVARREAPLRALADTLDVPTRVLPLDLSAPDLADQLAVIDDLEVGLVVYNAAYAPIGPFLEVSLADKLRILDVNCRGPLIVADHFGRPMADRGRGGLILMSSMAGFHGSALVATYAATKAFTTVFGEGLWDELGRAGVDVLVCPAGATLTPGFRDQTPERRQRAALPMEAEDVAREALTALGRGPVHVPGRTNRVVHAVLRRVLSHRAAARFMSRNTRRLYEDKA